MRAYHRLTGDFPRRGYGNSLRTPGFPEDGPVLNGTAPRLALRPSTMQPRPQDSAIVERFGTWELLALAYRQMAVVHASLVARAQGREHSYMDAVVAGDALQQAWPIPMEDLLLFNGFVTPEAFWNMEGGATALPAGDWTEDSPAMLENADDQGEALYAAPEGDALLRLLARYWHAASMQFFGPWTAETRDQFLYAADDNPVTCQLMDAPASLLAVLYDHTYHPLQIRTAKAFFHQTIMAKLPREVQGLATMSVGCTASSLNLFTGSALLVMPPEEAGGRADIDLRPGHERMPAASADELSLLRLILQSPNGLKEVPFLQPLREACRRACGPLDADRLAADWQLLLCLYRIDQAADAGALVRQWYLLNRLLRDRHITGESTEACEQRCNEWMRPVDMHVLRRLGLERAQSPEERRALGAQFDREKYLLGFFWRKAMSIRAGDERIAGLRALNACCQTPENRYFLSLLMNASKNPQSDAAAAAPILADALALYYAGGTLDDKHMQLLLAQDKRGQAVLQRHDALRCVMQDYLRGELDAYAQGQRAAFPDGGTDYSLYLLPLTMTFLPEDKPLESALAQATAHRAAHLLTERECALIRAGLEQLEDRHACEALLCRYVAEAFRAMDEGGLDALGKMVGQLAFRPGGAAKALLESAGGRYSEKRLSWLSGLCRLCGQEADILAARRAYAVERLLTLPELLTPAECRFIAASMGNEKDSAALQEAATAYFVARFADVVAQRLSAADLADVIRLTQLDAIPAAVQIIRAAAPQRLTAAQQELLLGGMAPEGANRQAIVRAWQTYVRDILAACAEAEAEDMLPWFLDSCAVCRRMGGLAEDSWADGLAVDYIVRHAAQQRKAPSPLAFEQLRRVAEGGFCGKAEQVRRMYDTVLAALPEASDAQAQAGALLPHLGSLTAAPTLKGLAEARLREQLQGQWRSGARYWDGLAEALGKYPASGLRAGDLHATADAAFAADVRAKAEDELASTRDPAAFAARCAIPLQEAGGFEQAWKQALRTAFGKRYDEMFLALGSFDALAALNDVSAQADAVEPVTALPAYRCGACLMKIRDELASLEHQGTPGAAQALSTLGECLNRLNCLDGYDAYAPVIHGLLAERFRHGQGTDFLCRMVNACLLSLRAQKAPPSWQGVLTILLPGGWQEMQRRPYAAENLPLLQAVAALLRILQGPQAPEGWRGDLVRFLKVNLSDYTAALLKGKAASAYLPQAVLDELK